MRISVTRGNNFYEEFTIEASSSYFMNTPDQQKRPMPTMQKRRIPKHTKA